MTTSARSTTTYLGVGGFRETVVRHLSRHWFDDVLDDAAFPRTVALRLPSGDTLGRAFGEVARASYDLARTLPGLGCEAVTAVRVLNGTRQRLVASVVVPDLEAAAGVAGDPWPAVVARGRRTVELLGLRSRPRELAVAVLKTTRTWDWEDVVLLEQAARWFEVNGSGTGLTARELPIPGMHAKWLDAQGRATLVAQVAGIESLGLVERPRRTSLTYLDPAHRAAGGRLHDDVTAGDTHRAPYEVRVVVVCENRDSQMRCPMVEGGVAVWGEGDAAVARLAALPWLAGIPCLVYWGDIDARGFAILGRVRAAYERADRPVRSLLMDRQARDARPALGTDRQADGRPIARGARPRVVGLTPTEQDLFDELTDPGYEGFLRFEQEKFSAAQVSAALGRMTGSAP